MAKIENDFLGLCDVRGACVVSANIWSKQDVMDSIDIVTTSSKVKRAFGDDKRYGLEKTVNLVRDVNSGKKVDQTELLRALMYRAKVAEAKSTVIGTRGAISVGVLNRR